MSKAKELIICIIAIIALVLTITTSAFATEGTPDINSLMTNNNTEENNNFEEIGETTNNTNTNTNTNTNVNTNTNINANVNNNTNTTTAIPYTGIDYSVVIIIAICGVSAIYAYKKIRDYNV